MQIQLEKTGECEATVVADVPEEEVKKMMDRIVAECTRSACLPGFRPGKTPVSIVAKHFAKEVQERLQTDMESELRKKCLNRIRSCSYCVSTLWSIAI